MPPLNDQVMSVIRTGVNKAIGLFSTYLLIHYGVGVSEEQSAAMTLVLGWFVSMLIYMVGRKLEARWPWVGTLLFGSRKQPTYGQPNH